MPDQPPDGVGDDALADRARAGELEAFNVLVRRYERRVFGLCLGMLRSPAAAEDAAQDAMISAWRALDGYRGGNFSAWLLRIAGNRCRDELRRRKRRPSTSLDVMVEEHGDAWSPPDQGRSPEAVALDAETGRTLLAALEQLPDEQRLAVVLSDVQGLSYREIADAMDTSIGTVKSRINRGTGADAPADARERGTLARSRASSATGTVCPADRNGDAMSRWRLWRRNISLGGRRRAEASAYLDGELTGRERERFEAQLDQSPEIREYVDDITLIQSQLSMLREARPSRSFELGAADVAPAQERPIIAEAAPPRRLRFAAVAAFASVAALAAVIAWDALDSGGGGPAQSQTAATQSASRRRSARWPRPRTMTSLRSRQNSKPRSRLNRSPNRRQPSPRSRSKRRSRRPSRQDSPKRKRNRPQ